MHLGSTRFWDTIGFGYARTGTGEGHLLMAYAPGQWGYGPFILHEWHTVLDPDQAIYL